MDLAEAGGVQHELDKAELRKQALALRAEVADHAQRSHTIVSRLRQLPEFQVSRNVLWYVSARTEVDTREALRAELAASRPVIVPYCHEDRLRLFRLHNEAELDRGRYGISEPRHALRGLDERRVRIEDVDLIVVPGVAFDPSGSRLGYGKGYYDKLLGGAVSSTRIVALAFECQIVPRIPIEPHDARLHRIVTEERIYWCEA